MVDDQGGELRVVAWTEIFPWLILARAFRLAIGFRLLLLSAVALAVTVTGWMAFAYVLLGGAESAEQIDEFGWSAAVRKIPDAPSLPGEPGSAAIDRCVVVGRQAAEPCELLTRPFRRLFTAGQIKRTDLAYALACGLWALAVWALIGGAITRTASVQLTRQDRISWSAMIRHATRKWQSYFFAPVFPLLGVLLVGFPIALLALLLRTDVGVLLLGLIWPLFLIGGLLVAVLLLGLVFGWPLMWATISSESTDSFDALSRSYAYVFQRPLHYLFYAAVAGLLGGLGWVLVSNFAAAVIGLTYWAASWGSGAERIDLIANVKELDGAAWVGASLIWCWVQCVKVLAVGYLYSYFWTAATAIYLLLRHDVDATEMDEVFLDEDNNDLAYGIPSTQSEDEDAAALSDEAASDEPGGDEPAGDEPSGNETDSEPNNSQSPEDPEGV